MYEAKENAPDSFELYEKSVGCFQITCTSKTIGEIPNLIEIHKLKTQAVGTNNLEFSEKYVSSEKFDVYFWMAVVDDKFLMCKYRYDTDKKESKK